MSVRVNSLQETEDLMVGVGKKLKERYGTEGHCVVGFSGDLGSGKTSCIRILARYFGYTRPVQSPTFCFVREYPLSGMAFQTLIHIDAYRCEDVRDVKTTGIADMCKKKDSVVCVEWFEYTRGLCPVDVRVYCLVCGDARCFEVVW